MPGVSVSICDFGAQPEKIIHTHGLLTPSKQGRDERSTSAKKEAYWEGERMLRGLEGLSVLKVVEVLPRYFIFIVKYSARMVDRGNFCSQPAIQK